MGDRTKIGWTDATWNFIRARNKETGKTGWHCEHATEACRFCYAERLNIKPGATGGTGLAYKPGHRKDIDIFLAHDALTQPVRWKQPRRIFPCSMTDIAADFVTDEWLEQGFAVMALAHWHTFQVLTKRPGRLRRFFSEFTEDGITHAGPHIRDALIEGQAQSLFAKLYPKKSQNVEMWLAVHMPLPNVWLGTSIAEQRDMDALVPDLLATPAALHFLSVEPMIGFIDISKYANRLGWVICGGESGPSARRVDPEMVRSLREQCADFGIPFFFKQWGKQQSGNLLDGLTHEAFPPQMAA